MITVALILAGLYIAAVILMGSDDNNHPPMS